MKIVVTGATGNVGSSVLRTLSTDPDVGEILGIARRVPDWTVPKTTWVRADIERDPLPLDGADAVIHLAWLIQPSRDRRELERVNVDGSRRVFELAADSRVGAIVHASSIGVYSPGPKHDPVDESWPREGIPTSFYSRHKAAAEHALDALEAAHPELRVVRLRPALIFQRDAASEIRRLFAGPLLPRMLVRPELLPVLPLPKRLIFQCVHAADVAQAYRLAATRPDARGAYNIAADPVLDPAGLGALFKARIVDVPEALLRTLADLTWRARLQPTPPGWLDLGLQVPTMDTTRARTQLGWQPKHSAVDALSELIAGMREGAGIPTPALVPDSARTRVREFLTGVGARRT